MTEQSYNIKYTGKEIDDLLDKANDMDESAQVPAGGTSGQVLTKKSGADFDTQWETPEAPSNPLPTGGSAGQVLAKSSNTDFDVAWIDQTGGSGGGSSDSDVVVALYQKDSSGAASLSMTYDEIVSAVGANKIVIIKDNAGTNAYCSVFVYQYTSTTYGLTFIGMTDSRKTYINTPFIRVKSDGTVTDNMVFRNGIVISGGKAGQFLRKKSNTDFDTEWVDAETGGFVASSNAGAHNAIYRGKYLGESVTAAQYAAIAAGTFDDLYIGDYWTIGGVNWRIAAFDYYLNSGDTACTTHHVVIVPDSCLYNAAMNSTSPTTGGYIGSEMRKANLEQAKSTIKTAFGAGHILTKREYLTNAVSNNAPTGGAWVDSDVELMNEVQVYGSVAWGTHNSNGNNVASGSGQFPLFMLDRTKMNIKNSYWLRDVSTNSNFSMTANDGVAGYGYGSITLGVRPTFCIY